MSVIQEANQFMSLTIAINTSISVESLNLIRNSQNVAIMTEGDWTAANLGFDGSKDGITWLPIRNLIGLLEASNLPTTGGWLVSLGGDSTRLFSFKYIRLASRNVAGSGVAVNQGAARTLFILLSDLKN